ncbi:MAG: hypothetical protein LBH17_04970 [Oscillospiraceae bacterium]|jgi:hypothetical protein|nr:hypothetical protein [Oscillospiraceae bacterium]
MNQTTIDYRNQNDLRKAGISALKKELGTVGAVYFLRQFSAGEGDYTREREKLLDGIPFDEIVNAVRGLDNQYTGAKTGQ